MKKKLSDLDKGYINEYGSRIESQAAAAKRMLQEAYDNGDMEKMAQAQEIISGLTIEKERLRIQKHRSERQTAAEQAQAAQQLVNRAQPQQPRQIDRKLSGWMEKNPWFGDGGDRVMTVSAQAIHEQIVANEGFDPLIAMNIIRKLIAACGESFLTSFRRSGRTPKPLLLRLNGRSVKVRAEKGGGINTGSSGICEEDEDSSRQIRKRSRKIRNRKSIMRSAQNHANQTRGNAQSVQEWRPGSALEAPEAPIGYKHRWIRESVMELR